MAVFSTAKNAVLDAIRSAAQMLGHSPSRAAFKAKSGMTEYQVFQHFPSWREAIRTADLEPDSTHVKLDDEALLGDWEEMVRRDRQIPTRDRYSRNGKYSLGVFERHFGPWSAIPSKFREFAQDKTQWADVSASLPEGAARSGVVSLRGIENGNSAVQELSSSLTQQRYAKLDDRPTYSNPIDFRGLRHEPVNEQGVVFLFGVVVKELGYTVEALQAGYPDCEAKRQVAPGGWQRVRIEFEFESRNFRDHGHPPVVAT